jgi:type I restriction enzyme S subunit
MDDQEAEAGDHPWPEKALKRLFAQSHDRGRAGLPVMSLSMGRGLVPRNQDERRVETNLSDEQHRLVRDGELAYNMMRMWQGVCSLAEEDCLISPAYVVVRPLDGMDPKFSEYLLTYEDTVAQFKRLSFGVVDDRLRLYYKDFERVRVNVPSPTAQRKIAKILTTLDNLIEKTETLIAKYQAVKQGMMHDLLTRGVDEHGHLRPPQAEAPHLYKPSPLGWVPRTRELVRCGEVCHEIVVGIVIQPAQYYQEIGVPVLRSANVRESGLDGTNLVFMSEESNHRLSKSMVRHGDIITVRTGLPGTSCTVPMEFDGANCVDILISRPGPRLRSAFLASWINSDSGKNQVLRKQGGLAQQHFNVGELKQLLVSLPAVDEQERISAVLHGQDLILRREREEAAKLKLLKSGLMQNLLTGKVPVHVDPAEEAVHA